jgi:DNA cross-link repair 1A protein
MSPISISLKKVIPRCSKRYWYDLINYFTGKEKVFLGIAEALDCKLWAHSDKRKVLECIDNPIINERLTDKQWEAHVHVCRMSDLNMSVS